MHRFLSQTTEKKKYPKINVNFFVVLNVFCLSVVGVSKSNVSGPVISSHGHVLLFYLIIT